MKPRSPTFPDRERDRTRRLTLTPEDECFLRDRGRLMCEECYFEGLGIESAWRPLRPDDYFDRGNGIALCPRHLKESGYMHQTDFDRHLSALAGLDDETIAGDDFAASTIERSPDVRLARRLRTALRRQRVVDFHEEGMTAAAISAQMAMPLRSVQRILENPEKVRSERFDLTEDERRRGQVHFATMHGVDDAENRDAQELQEWFDTWTARQLAELHQMHAEALAERDRLTTELAEATARLAERAAENERLDTETARLTAYAAELEMHPALRTNGKH